MISCTVLDDKAKVCQSSRPSFHSASTFVEKIGAVSATAAPSVGMPPLFATFLSATDTVLKISIPAAVNAAVETANTAAEVEIVNIPS